MLDLRTEALRMEFFDVAAVIVFLRKVIWTVPGFTVDAYWDRLLELHQRIDTHGPFIAHSQRFLIEAHKAAECPGADQKVAKLPESMRVLSGVAPSVRSGIAAHASEHPP